MLLWFRLGSLTVRQKTAECCGVRPSGRCFPKCLCLVSVYEMAGQPCSVLVFALNSAWAIESPFDQVRAWGNVAPLKYSFHPHFAPCSVTKKKNLMFYWFYLQGVALWAVTLERRSITREQDPLGESLHDPKVPQSSSAWTRCHLWTRKQCSSSPWWQAFPHYPCASRTDSG